MALERAGCSHLEKVVGFHPMTAWADHGADGNGNPWPSRCGPGTRARTPPPTTSRPPGWPRCSCRSASGAGPWSSVLLRHCGTGSRVEARVRAQAIGCSDSTTADTRPTTPCARRRARSGADAAPHGKEEVRIGSEAVPNACANRISCGARVGQRHTVQGLCLTLLGILAFG